MPATFYKNLVRPLLFSLDPETVHELSLSVLGSLGKKLSRNPINDDPRLAVEVAGLRFPNRIGLAAGMDKACKAPYAWQAFGFGFIEVGTITNVPQLGNERPRLFRIPEQQSLLNHLGFNNPGASALINNLSALKEDKSFRIPLGINIGKSRVVNNKDTEAVVKDYLESLSKLKPFADFLVINVSSPNTPGLREWQSPAHLKQLLAPIKQQAERPVFLKISPDLERDSLEEIIQVASELQIDGLIATNTTVSRRNAPPWTQLMMGGISGQLLKSQSIKITTWIAEIKPKNMALISVGGICSADDIKQRLDLGADLVQLYSGLIYEGPDLINQLNLSLLSSF